LRDEGVLTAEPTLNAPAMGKAKGVLFPEKVVAKTLERVAGLGMFLDFTKYAVNLPTRFLVLFTDFL
jgi:hypothetical protein